MSIKQKKVIFNIILILLVIGSGIIMYTLKEDKNPKIKTDITVESPSANYNSPKV